MTTLNTDNYGVSSFDKDGNLSTRLGALPPVGSFGLSRIGGWVGKLVAAGQAFAGDGSRFTHAFIVLNDTEVLEARPGGVGIGKLADRLADHDVVFCDEPVQDWLQRQKIVYDSMDNVGGELSDPEAYWGYVENLKRADIRDIARSLLRTKYGYLQYLYLGLLTFGVDSGWLKKLITNRRHLICSQLVDEVFRRAGIQLFDDGRLSQDVTPGDLAIRFGIA